jgi:hypothetical protein
MQKGIQFRVVYSDSDLLKLRISASNGQFAGVADVYVGRGYMDETAGKLKDFPRNPSDVREAIFSSFGPASAGGAVSMRFYCDDGAGHAWVDSKIESEDVIAGTRQTVLLTLAIEPAAMDTFLQELPRLETDTASITNLRGAL